MSERCPDCGRPFATTAFEETSPQFCNGAKSYGCLRSRIAKLEAAVEAADALYREALVSGLCGEYLHDYDAAKAELERVKG